MNSPFGRCPICSEELASEGDLLRCRYCNYTANAQRFSDRWEKYFAEVKERGSGFNSVAASGSLMRDLQEMNIKERK